jgi:hypothetical protein
MGDLLAVARILVAELYVSMELSTSRYGGTIRTGTVPSMVPTSTPREILYQMLCNTAPITNSLISRGPLQTLQNLRELIQVKRQVPVVNPAEHLNLRRVADGTPRIFFVCAHETGQFCNRYALYLGASQSDWGAFNAINVIRRADRDWKMRNYTHRALKAFTELQRIESGIHIRAPNSEKDRSYRRWLLAIQQMRRSPYFLGDRAGV